MNVSDESSAYDSGISTDKQLSEKEEDYQVIENDDDNSSPEKMKMEHVKKQSKECKTNMTYATATVSAKAYNDTVSESKDMIFSKTFIDKKDHNLITKLCNSEEIYGKFRTWMNI